MVPVPAVRDSIDVAPDTFRQTSLDLARRVAGAAKQVEVARERLRHLRAGILALPDGASMLSQWDDLNHRLENVATRLVGDPVRQKLAEPRPPAIRDLVDRVTNHHWDTTSPPTSTQRASMERAADAFESVAAELAELVGIDLAALTADLDAAGGAWTPR